ncbi:Hypothetical predicted protein [Marmota monax]|uniref:Uncharacterized protein n=1 Tax=Marmota monax TaxID=9995 RepID=A0A5E4BZ68_MARMO|nr:Hypothetical predicted protein [Marmota monax]
MSTKLWDRRRSGGNFPSGRLLGEVRGDTRLRRASRTDRRGGGRRRPLDVLYERAPPDVVSRVVLVPGVRDPGLPRVWDRDTE